MIQNERMDILQKSANAFVAELEEAKKQSELYAERRNSTNLFERDMATGSYQMKMFTFAKMNGMMSLFLCLGYSYSELREVLKSREDLWETIEEYEIMAGRLIE